MRIDVPEFTITLTESELYAIMFAFRDKFLASAEHCSMHKGMDTFFYNYQREADMMKEMAIRLNRVFVYDECMKDLEKEIELIKSNRAPA